MVLVVGGIVVVALASVVVVEATGFWFATARNQAAACAGEPSFLLFEHPTSPGTRAMTSSTPVSRRMSQSPSRRSDRRGPSRA
jgi:hypothetical protein